LAAGATRGSPTFAGLGEKCDRIELQTWICFHTTLARQT
jgi:hypothetical protein